MRSNLILPLILAAIGTLLVVLVFKARQFLRDVGIWLALGLALIVGYSSKDQLAPVFSNTIASLSPGTPADLGDGRVVIKKSENNDFTIKSNVNNADIRFIFDTGASAVVLTYDDAIKAGFTPDRLSFGITVSTANGTTKTAPIKIGVIQVGTIVRENVRGLVAQRGDLRTSLLGMTFMDTLTSFQVTGDTLEFVD